MVLGLHPGNAESRESARVGVSDRAEVRILQAAAHWAHLHGRLDDSDHTGIRPATDLAG